MAPIPQGANYPAVVEAAVTTDLLGQARRDVAVAPADLAAVIPPWQTPLATVKINAGEKDHDTSLIAFAVPAVVQMNDPDWAGGGSAVCGYRLPATMGPPTIVGLERGGGQDEEPNDSDSSGHELSAHLTSPVRTSHSLRCEFVGAGYP